MGEGFVEFSMFRYYEGLFVPGVEQTGIYILYPGPEARKRSERIRLTWLCPLFWINSTFYVHTALAAVGVTSSEQCLKGRVDN